MKREHLWPTVRRTSLPLVLLANGCMATFERNLDYLMSPDALESTLLPPFNELAPLVQFLLRLVI
jgi:hypothetical protein